VSVNTRLAPSVTSVLYCRCRLSFPADGSKVSKRHALVYTAWWW